ncbi:putative hemagglutinin-related protein [Leifsonia rubra CMS 76R]|nr:putative hemagglutinin-related protein [Leifsonia rubra CMS 76R]
MEGSSAGISLLRSRSDGSLERVGLAAAVPSASFLVADGEQVYATLEGSDGVVAFDRVGETLTNRRTASSGGEYPCHLTVHGSVVVAANYRTGSIGIIERSEGSGASAVLQHRGSVQTTGGGPRPEQEGPHAHSSLFVDDHTLVTLDLGADRIRIFDYRNFALTPVDEVVLPAGFGPRDIVARPNNVFFVLGELGLGVIVYEWRDREFHQLCAVSLPEARDGDHASAIAISPDSRHAYVGVRGSNLIAVLTIAEDGCSVAPLTAVSCEGDWPRHIVQHENVLHVSNQFSNTVASFRLDGTGIPRLIAAPVHVLSPTYLVRIPDGF